MQKRRLGQSHIYVSPLGLGTVKFGRNEAVKYPEAFSLPSMQTLDRLLNVAFDAGINLLDTAPAYGESEARIGKLLKNTRNQWIISSKVGELFSNGQSFFNFSRAHLNQSIEDSLKRLKTDYIDIILVHSNGADIDLIENDEVFATLEQWKQSGKIRAYGMSTKTIAGGLSTIRMADVAMITYNIKYQNEQVLIDFAKKQQKGIFVKKAFASGHLKKIEAYTKPTHVSHTFIKTTYSDALHFVLKEPGVTSVLIGTINEQHLLDNILCTRQKF